MLPPNPSASRLPSSPLTRDRVLCSAVGLVRGRGCSWSEGRALWWSVVHGHTLGSSCTEAVSTEPLSWQISIVHACVVHACVHASCVHVCACVCMHVHVWVCPCECGVCACAHVCAHCAHVLPLCHLVCCWVRKVSGCRMCSLHSFGKGACVQGERRARPERGEGSGASGCLRRWFQHVLRHAGCHGRRNGRQLSPRSRCVCNMLTQLAPCKWGKTEQDGVVWKH